MQKPMRISRFQKTLVLFLTTLIWPLIGGGILAFLSGIGIPGLKATGILLALIEIGLILWLCLTFWKLAPEVKTSPWATLWIFFPVWGAFITAMLFLEPLKYQSDKKPTSKKLLLSWPLIKETISQYMEILPKAIKTSAWFIYLAFITGVTGILGIVWPFLNPLTVLITAVTMIFGFWVTIKLFIEIADLEAKKTPSKKTGDFAKKNFLSYIWVLILNMFFVFGIPLLLLLSTALIGAILGLSGLHVLSQLTEGTLETLGMTQILQGAGLLLLMLVMAVGAIIWAIYKSNALTFAIPSLLLDEKRGMDAVRESTRIVRKRWWGVFWKMQLWGIFFGAATIALGIAIGIILSLIQALSAKIPYGEMISFLFSNLAQGTLQMLLLPIALLFVIKLYRSFKRTAEN